MINRDFVCTEFSIKGGICNAYKDLPLLLYPNHDEIRTFCKTENYEKCPILKGVVENRLVCV